MVYIAVHPETEKEFKERPGISILLTVIAGKVLEKEDKIKSLKETALKEIEEWRRQKELLEDFENRHKDELFNICPAYLQPLRRSGIVHPFLFGPINHLNCLIDGNFQLLETPENFHHELNGLSKIPEGFSEPISMDQFTEMTGWSSKIVKSLLSELMRCDLVASQKVSGCFCYRVNESIYIERTQSSMLSDCNA
jgi:hypothetical protein